MKVILTKRFSSCLNWCTKMKLLLLFASKKRREDVISFTLLLDVLQYCSTAVSSVMQRELMVARAGMFGPGRDPH